MQKPGPPLQRYHHRKNNPSFSSSLLDAITRSLDDSDSGNLTGGAPDPPTVTRLNYSTPSSSSSSSSSFFSSDSDTCRIKPIRTGPVLTRSDRIRSDPNQTQTQKQTEKSRNRNLTSLKKKLRDLRRSNGQNSPGAKLAGFLNSIFAGNPKKPKIAGDRDRDRPPPPPLSCMIKSPLTRGSNGGKRSVRFSEGPVRFSGPVRMEEEEDGWQSDSSEDLFELENLGGFIAKSGGNYGSNSFRDELPVYGTTNLGRLGGLVV